MTLLIACLLIYNFNLPVWWYAIAALVWLVRSTVIYSAYADLDKRRNG